MKINKKPFARGVVLKQRHNATQKWPIAKLVYSYFEKGCRQKVHATISKGIVGPFNFTVSRLQQFRTF